MARVVAAMWAVGLVAAAALVFAIISIAQNVGLHSDLAVAQRRIASLQGELTRVERVGERDRRTFTDLLSPEAKHYAVAEGTVVVRGPRIYLVLSNLPMPPRGRIYEAWTEAKGAEHMAPSVRFRPNANGLTIVPLPVDAARVGSVALSVEPEGGSKAPTAITFIRALS